MNKLFILVVLCFTLLSNTTIDYCLEQLEEDYNSTCKLWRNGDRDSALLRMEFLKKQSLILEDTLMIYSSCNSLGIYHKELSNYDKSIYYFEKSLEVCLSPDFFKKRMSLYLNLSRVNRLKGDYTEALSFLNTCFLYLNKVDDIEQIKYLAFNEMSLIQLFYEQYDSALFYVDSSLDICLSMGLFKDYYRILNNKGLVFINEGKFTKAHNVLNKCLGANKEDNSEHYRTYFLKAQAYLKQEKYDLGEQFFLKYYYFSKNKSCDTSMLRSMVFLSECHTGRLEFAKAEQWLIDARKLANGQNYISLQVDIKRAYIDVYSKSKNYIQLQVCNEELAELEAKMYVTENRKSIAAALTKYEELSAQKDEDLQIYENSYHISKIILISFFIVFTFIILFFSRYLFRLYKRESILKLQLDTYISGSNKENALICKNLRSSVYEQLGGLNLMFENSQADSVLCDRISDISKDILRSSRSLELSRIANLDFDVCVSESIKYFNASVNVSFDIELLFDFTNMEYFNKLNYLHILLDLLDYSLRNDTVSEVSILFCDRYGDLVFYYSDNMYLSKNEYTTNLDSVCRIKSRVQFLNAKLYISLSNKQSTCVCVYF